MTHDLLINEMLEVDHQHIWHPYSAMNSEIPVFPVQSAHGVYLTLASGQKLIDGMSSWWAVIHGYNHPAINNAIENQLKNMAHVMFGGLTHIPAINLTQQLIQITPDPLQKVFYSDSGSVAIDIAMKMAIQYWHSKGQKNKKRFISLRSGYHGDTIGAMSVSDPETGMHTIFNESLPQQIFIDQPRCRFGEPCNKNDILSLESALNNYNDVAAFILEPIVQGAGGMWFYSADYLKQARKLCDQYNILLIFDEIATGFGRTGKLFACEHAGISPDIMCIGKALTGGYLTLAATLTTENISNAIDQGDPGVFMHGPTYMANPLACTAALTSILLLKESTWEERVMNIQSELEKGLEPCREFEFTNDVRVLGAIGVVELNKAVDMKTIVNAFIKEGVWIRPFGNLVYLMPPFIIEKDQLDTLTQAVTKVLSNLN